MTPTARNICTCAVFASTFFLNFGLPTYFVSHYGYERALYAVFYRRLFLKKSIVEQSCLTVACQMACHTSHGHTSFGVYRVDTMFFVLLVQFALIHLKI